MVASNVLLFKPPQPSVPAGTKDAKGEHSDHIVVHQDLLLAMPLILGLGAPDACQVLQRVGGQGLQAALPVLSLFSYMLKAPLARPSMDLINSLNRQRNAAEAFLKACIGLSRSRWTAAPP
ncbi:hypothetical protein L226DRAFT_603222 [Lentinus tigrinus ALCF2SS1-7]|uniref:Uncharacterized protein n=1 Tax=Lentinus tigrinus ALCF2SS1-6 TaxID=1328759 RepID=A0A5C2RPQ0_9APHY|nr:hypothetical protein L227DRAFT_617825 [Lentinus tigrinus ALCF2SS1-6]RPD67987.1 hypothetical protein L226DRAFT_603222 [Lentinus tigrinus ALCF2SS1-7]